MKRQKILESIPLTVLRFQDSDVRKNLNAVVEVINDWMIKNIENS